MASLGPRFRAPPYTFHILSSLALTSLAYHNLNQRRQVEEERIQLAGRTSVLEELVQRTRENDGKNIRVADVDRMMKLAKGKSDAGEDIPQLHALSWKEVVLGKRHDPVSVSSSQSKGMGHEDELEMVQKEWNAAVHESNAQPSASSSRLKAEIIASLSGPSSQPLVTPSARPTPTSSDNDGKRTVFY